MSGNDLKRGGTHSCILFHGPTAQGRAAEAASSWGRVLGTFGNPIAGLDVATIRSAVILMSNPVLGDDRGAVVVGPVDILSQEGVTDILLKTIEEMNPRVARPYLWAWDEGGVRATIRSRCLMEWCPGEVPLDRDILLAARMVVDAALARSTVGVIEGFAGVLSPSDEDKRSWREVGEDFLRAVARDLSRREGREHLWLWAAVRPVLLREVPSREETLVRFLP